MVIVVGALSNAAVLYAVTTVRCARSMAVDHTQRSTSVYNTVGVTVRCARSVASALIGNLAAADLWHCLFCLPIQLHYQLTDRWVFGAVLCHKLGRVTTTGRRNWAGSDVFGARNTVRKWIYLSHWRN